MASKGDKSGHTSIQQLDIEPRKMLDSKDDNQTLLALDMSIVKKATEDATAIESPSPSPTKKSKTTKPKKFKDDDKHLEDILDGEPESPKSKRSHRKSKRKEKERDSMPDNDGFTLNIETTFNGEIMGTMGNTEVIATPNNNPNP